MSEEKKEENKKEEKINKNQTPQEAEVSSNQVENQASNDRATEENQAAPQGENAEERLEETEKLEGKKEHPDFRAGDTVKVMVKIVEGEKERIQPFQGVVISKKGRGQSKTFTVRKIGVHKIGVERIWPLHSPTIDSIEIVKRGKVKRAKLYYLRDKVGKEALKVKAASE